MVPQLLTLEMIPGLLEVLSLKSVLSRRKEIQASWKLFTTLRTSSFPASRSKDWW